MARPKKNLAEKRGKPMSFRPASETEEQSIMEKVRQSGLSASEYLRQAALRSRVVVKESKSKVDFDLIYELNKVGVNLNQLVHASHIRGEIPAAIPNLCEKIERLIMQAVEQDNADGSSHRKKRE